MLRRSSLKIMPQQTLDYRRHEESPPLWYRSDWATAVVTIGIILSTNGWLVWSADKGWGFPLWVFALIPLANGVLAVLLVVCSPIVRRIFGTPMSLHVWITVIGCGTAVLVDAALIFALLHG